jgi:hypothetical protein
MPLRGPTVVAVLFAVPSTALAQADDSREPVDFLPIPDRWRVPFGDWSRYADAPGLRERPYDRGQWWNPYKLNTLKGDFPIVGQEWFLATTITNDTITEWRRLPTPSGVSAAGPRSDPFFGRGEQFFVDEHLLASIELFKGDAGYRPRDVELRVTPVFDHSYLRLREQNGVSIDPRDGDTRNDHFLGLQEAFVEVHLADTTPFYDFVSTRVGVQGFTSDFRGFVFSDHEPGVRLFGNAQSNRVQWNLAWFDFVEKDTNSGLVQISDTRDQQLSLANLYVQDCLAPGWTHELSFLWNRDHGGPFVDDNGFPVRPSRLGDAQLHELDVFYAGWTSDGHVGPVNVSHAFYEVFGRDSHNPLAGRRQNVNAQMAALELSRDFDWLRPKVSAFYASGDSRPTDGEANGFDAVFDNPNFVGGQFSFWNRQGIPLTGTAVALVDRFSLLPSLRTTKLHDQANFVNPGIFIANAGVRAKVTQECELEANANWMRFMHTEPLELALNDDKIRPEIGWDLSLGTTARPFLTDNVIVTAGVAWLIPETGVRDLYGNHTLFSGFVALTLTW